MRFNSLTGACLVLIYCTLLPQKIESKKFGECELANYLAGNGGTAHKDIPTWVCIATKESALNSNKVSKLNKNGSRDHGIFQINDKYWCTAKGPAGKGCNAKCAAFEDNDIADDVECVKKIFAETKRVKGNGFKAWTTYKFCDTPAKVDQYVKGCEY